MAESSSEEAQARRALASAEQRFLAGDVAGARRCAQHALSLAPGLHGAEQALVAYDVHAAAPDWYAVLGLGVSHPRPSGDQSAVVVTHDDVKRQHRRLCLLVHPDKNPSAAADGAFKIVQAAYDSALSAMRVAEAAARTAWEEEAAVSRFWQTAADDITPTAPVPKQTPIARPPPRWAAPAAGQPGQPPPQPPSWAAAQGVQTPQRQRAPAPSNLYATQPTMPGKPYCSYYPLCVWCRLYASTAPMSGKPHCNLYPFCVCCRL